MIYHYLMYLCRIVRTNKNTNTIMKRAFTLLPILALLFVSCDKGLDGDTTKNFVITSPTIINVDADGDTVAITYTIENAVIGEDVQVEVLRGESAIGSIEKPAIGVVLVDVLANSTAEERSIILQVSYDADVYPIAIKQSADGDNNGSDGGNGGDNGDNGGEIFEAQYLNGYYYGELYTADFNNVSADRYAFFLSDNGLNNAGQAYTNSTYYYIDCFSAANKSISLPLGIYTFDTSNSGKPNTIHSENSRLIITGNNIEDTQEVFLTDAKMAVSERKIVLEVTIDGKVHKVVYNGDLTLTDVSGENEDGENNNGGDITDGQDGEGQSTLTDDRHVTFDGEHRAKWGYEGDYWKTGYSNYTIFIMNKSNGYVYGDTLQFDLITDNTSSDGRFAGKYTISNNPGKLVMMAGFTNSLSQPVGSWLYEYGGSSASGYTNYAMIKSGSVEFIDNGDGTHTVILDSYDCHGNNITCNWTGVIEKD